MSSHAARSWVMKDSTAPMERTTYPPYPSYPSHLPAFPALPALPVLPFWGIMGKAAYRRPRAS